jgi:hypothetical protein
MRLGRAGRGCGDCLRWLRRAGRWRPGRRFRARVRRGRCANGGRRDVLAGEFDEPCGGADAGEEGALDGEAQAAEEVSSPRRIMAMALRRRPPAPKNRRISSSAGAG